MFACNCHRKNNNKNYRGAREHTESLIDIALRFRHLTLFWSPEFRKGHGTHDRVDSLKTSEDAAEVGSPGKNKISVQNVFVILSLAYEFRIMLPMKADLKNLQRWIQATIFQTKNSSSIFDNETRELFSWHR